MAMDEALKTGSTPAKADGAVVLNVKYETAPGVVRAGAFVLRHPSLGDEAAIVTKAAQIASPARLMDLPFEDQEFMRACAAIMVLGGPDPAGKASAGSVPDWYKTDSAEIRDDLPLRVYSAFLGERQKMFRGTGSEGEGEIRRPLVEVVPAVG